MRRLIGFVLLGLVAATDKGYYKTTAEEAPVDPTAVRPFTIDVPQAVLDDLQVRLEQTRLPDQLDGAGWDYGTELD